MTETRGRYATRPKALKTFTESSIERLFRLELEENGIEGWIEQVMLFEASTSAFDFVWLEQKLAVELQGGTWSNGAHTRGRGYERDCRKLNDAVLLGYRVMWFTTDMVQSNEAIMTIKEALG